MSNTPSGPARPATIRWAVGLMYLGAAWFAVVGIVLLIVIEMMRRDLRTAADVGAFPAGASGFAVGLAVALAVTALATVALWVWMAVMNRKGRPWARLVATALGAVTVLGIVGDLTGPGGLTTTDRPGLPDDAVLPAAEIALAVQLATLVLIAVILVLLWRRESSEFYAAASSPGLRPDG